jgi:polar amino acid transport system substrate-binding protein
MRFNRILLLLGLVATSALAEQPVAEIFIPDAMPLAASHDSMGHGLMGDVALEAIKRAGYRATIKTEPWLRAQKRVREGHNLFVVPLSRTPQREDKYTWVAAVLPLARAFFTFDTPVQTFEQARTRYQRIGVSIGTAQEEILRANGFQSEQIYSLQLGDHPLKLLELNRIDAWFTTVPEGQYHWARSSSRPLLKSPELATTDLYLACSKRCDADLVQAVRTAAEKMRTDGSMARIIDRYSKPAPTPENK